MNSLRTVALSVASLFLLLSCAESNAPPAASQLAFTLQPTNATVGIALAPAVQVTARDAQGSIVSSLLRYYRDLNLETGVITNCQPMPNFCMAIDDFYLAYNSTRAVPAVVFQNQQGGTRRIAHLAGRSFSGVHLADTTGAGFVATLIDQPFDNTRTILVRTEAGNVYKLGNPVGFGTQQADSVRFQAARLN